MLDTRIILSGSWIALMLIHLLGDVPRMFSGDFVPSASKRNEMLGLIIPAQFSLSQCFVHSSYA